MIFRSTSYLIKPLSVTAFFITWLLIGFTAQADRPGPEDRVQISIDQSPILGNPKASVTIVEFSDFECPFCKSVQPTLKEIQQHYPNQVRLVFKNFPLRIHHNARQAHLAALCAEDQGKFWEYSDLLFQHQRMLKRGDLLHYANELKLATKPFELCLDSNTYASKIDRDLEEAANIGVEGTPAFLVNGRPLLGAQPFSSFQQIIDEELS